MENTKNRARSSARRGRYSGGQRSSYRGGGNRGRSSFRNKRGKRAMPSFDPTQFINKTPTEAPKEEVYEAKHSFADFAIDERVKKTLADMGIKTPTPIQDQVIPKILNGEDVVGLAETGTGKTAAFLIPLIERKKADMRSVTLILTPTRELAIQVENEFRKLARGLSMYSVVCVGGAAISPQIKALRRSHQFIIGTPGRVKDLITRRILDMRSVNTIVLDEADRMLDMGFVHDMREIMSLAQPNRHTLFFSATMEKRTTALIHEFMKEPVVVSVKKSDVTKSIEQDVVRYQQEDKFTTLVELLSQPDFRRVIVFGAMKRSVENLGKDLNRSGIASESIHGNKNHGQRQRSLNRFKSGQAKVLVATDVAARGIHVDNVTHVINYDLPNTFEDYVHRIGRTGRGSQRGKALSFVQNRG